MQSDGLSLPLNILEGKGTYILVLNLDKETVISVSFQDFGVYAGFP